MSILSSATLVRRETFNPKNKDHLKSLSKFVHTGNWGEIQFHVEQPFTNVPATVMDKFIKAALPQAN